MAQKRMFTREVIETDSFLDMALSAQALYFHLLSVADDDGFVSKPNAICRMIRATNDDLQALIDNNLIIQFSGGVIVIRHWLVHNTIQKDRYHPTKYETEKSKLIVNDNKEYCYQNGNRMETFCEQNESSDLGLDLDIDIEQGKQGDQSGGLIESEDDLNDLAEELEDYGFRYDGYGKGGLLAWLGSLHNKGVSDDSILETCKAAVDHNAENQTGYVMTSLKNAGEII